jgi:hypothetical protein
MMISVYCIIIVHLLLFWSGRLCCFKSTNGTKSWMRREIFIALKVWIMLFCVMIPCILVGITTYKTHGAINHLSCVNLQY